MFPARNVTTAISHTFRWARANTFHRLSRSCLRTRRPTELQPAGTSCSSFGSLHNTASSPCSWLRLNRAKTSQQIAPLACSLATGPNSANVDHLNRPASRIHVSYRHAKRKSNQACRHPHLPLQHSIPASPHLCRRYAARPKSLRTCNSTANDDQALRVPGDGDSVASLKRQLSQVSSQLSGVRSVMDVDALRAQLAMLQNDAAAEDLWDDAAAAQKLLTSINNIKGELDELHGNEKAVEDAEFVVELLEAEDAGPDTSSLLAEAFAGLRGVVSWLEGWEVRRLLNGRFDEGSARLSVQAGAGGTDAMDWAEMLERMYVRWSNSRGYKVTVVDRKAGEEAGIQSVELQIEGRYAYGYLHGEKGTHRLVRNSPFNSKGLRQTSFAGVEVMPVLEDELDLNIPPKELEVQFMRSGGKGGQNVNKVETGVRITHVPTGLTVKCTEERSQELNRTLALERLKAKLLVVLEEQRAKEVAEIRGDVVKAEWGQQIRNYVFCPYKLVKDTRTGEETSNVGGVMDGELDAFIKAYLKCKASRQNAADARSA